MVGGSLSDFCGVTPIPPGTTIPWRIIGVFDDKIRIVRAESIGNYSWDTSDTYGNYGVNEWSQADLMKLLNPGYESEEVGGSLWWNSESGNCYNNHSNATTVCDFSNTGVSSTSKKYVIDQTFYLGGFNSKSVYANVAYKTERENNLVNNPSDGVPRTLSWTGIVGLPYPSDFGYAIDFKNCSNQLDKYGNCSERSWLHSDLLWTISPSSTSGNSVMRFTSSGLDSIYAGYNYGGAYPVLTLKQGIERASGTGTEDDPFKIK